MLKTQATNRRVSDTPICLATANGSTRADEVADVTVGALHTNFTLYILDEIPAVLSVGAWSRGAVFSGQQAASRTSSVQITK